MNAGSQSSRTTDMTPQPFVNLQQPFANVLAGLLGYQPTQPGGGTTTTGGTTPRAPVVGATPQTGNQAPGEYGRAVPENTQFQLYNMMNQGQGQTTAAPTNPFFTAIGFDPNDPNTALRGIPSYRGPLTAGITGNEQTLLADLMRQRGGQASGPSQDYLRGLIGGQGVPAEATPEGVADFVSRLGLGAVPDKMTPEQVTDFVNRLGLGYTPDQTLAQFADELQGASNTGAYGGAQNPFLQSYIEAAQRPTQQLLEETLSRTLPGRFTQAGQFIQPQGSSAFDRAAAIATRGAAQEAGDIATRISYQALEAAQKRESDALAAELERRGEYGEAARVRNASAIDAQLNRAQAEREAALGRQATATEQQLAREQQQREAALDRQLEAATKLPGVNAQEIDNLIKNLTAQGLPRLIEDMGIERGIDQFNNRLNALMTTLGVTAGVTRPALGQQSSGSQFGISSPFK